MLQQQVMAEDVLESLTRVVEPAYGVNIVDLGLVYGVEVDRDRASVEMTLTSPGSPTREAIAATIDETLLRRHAGLTRVDVEFVREPEWREDFITEAGRRQLAAPIAPAASGIPTSDDLLESLRLVIDPEIGLNIVDLGLVYDVGVEGPTARIEMTLTTPGCPLHATIEDAVRRVVETRHATVTEVALDLVWEPPWDTDRISPEGRRQLGWA